jgi:chromosome segregation protein
LYITELEIDNFKSFVKKVKIPFYEGFSVISGPNGSGKSNIIDSILFVLALSGSRSLRAEKLTDLINLNSGKNTAEVSITFSDGTRIRRRIKRTGSGYYSYNYLNDRLCKQTDVIEFLSRQGIKPHGYNVVMQGDITRIIEMSDFERRRIIDEIAGVAEFDAKKEQALSELEVVRERIEREEMILHELTIRLSELRAEREQALLYRDLEEKLTYFQAARNAARLHDQERELAGLARLIADQQVELERVASDRGLEENELAYLKADLREIDLQINQKSGSEYLKLIADLEETKSAIKLAEQAIVRSQREKEESLEGMNRIYLDEKRAETRIAECNDAVRNLSVDRTNLSMESATLRAQCGKLEAQITQESRDTEGARDRLFALLKEIEEKKAERSAVLRQQDLLLEKSRMRSSERERMEERARECSGARADKQKQVDELEKNRNALERDIKELDRALSTLEGELFARRGTLERVRNEGRALEQEIVRLEAMAQARGETGGKALEAVLGMDGVHGTIAQLGKAPPEYATALNVAAGAKLHYVVTDTDSVASRAIAYLKDQNLGRATFLPLNKLRKVQLDPVKEDGVIDYAIRLLSYDPQFTDAFSTVFGGTLILSNLDQARRLMGRYRMATLEGELLEKSGAMTGGSFKKAVRGFGAAVADDIGRMRAQLAGMQEEAQEIATAVERMSTENTALRTKRGNIDQQIERYRMMTEEFGRQCTGLADEEAAIARAITALDEEVRTGSSELAALESRLDGATAGINQLTEAVATTKRKLEGTDIPALSEQLEKKKREVEEVDRRLRNKEADITDQQRERQHFTRRIEELKEEQGRAQAKIQQLEEERANARRQIAESTARIKEIEERQKEFSGELEGLRTRHNEVGGQIQESERRLLEFDVVKERINLQVTALREREQTLAQEIEVLRGQVGAIDTDLSLTEIEDKIAEASYAMKKIGAVNMLAIEEFDRVDRRVTDRTAKKDVLSRERATIIERIEKYAQMKYEAFMEAFRAINANFREVFARLTDGNGHLILEHEEDPFAGGMTFAVQPRDKTIHLLSSLSGGEKSLTTLAFIFSIQQYIPAPFYALDEVDMSLDGSNVERIATMIRELAVTSQFIIVSLRKPMIEGADRIMGVTLRPDKSSLVTGIKVNPGINAG